MKKPEPLPEHLHQIREILMDSADGPEGDEDIPTPPGDLLDDLEKDLTDRPVPVSSARPGFASRLRRFLASPGFGLAAALVVVLFVAMPLLKGPESFRDQGKPLAAGPRIVLVGADDAGYERLASHGLIDPDSLIRATDADDAAAVTPPKLVIRFADRSLSGIDDDGSERFRETLPDDPADLPAALADAASRLAAE